MNTRDLITALRGRGFLLAVVDGKLAVRPATRLAAADREAIRRNLPELVAALANESLAPADMKSPTVSDAWDGDLAHRLMYTADTLVSELGVSGCRTTVQDAAEAVVRAHAAENMTELRRAVSVFVTVVRGLGARSSTEARAG
ncbi:hypothetical protein GobsT_49560 [Gemmata obscuriglobus]|uniref:TubC N-terminal docking domain-containing protein n=1 Tax=Gemmata obscuriglobus TaxID=114 RepID=A0A2Z3H7W2_9BACT|nr:hypothetical protein [Gemmata obscuriglobus]AWM37120.1 hypothetical protein C1280_08840 [Gemmata obscuriglobus]QEG30154.1 hypothetical protein GobsT_49560 [Gemmata obscuriglobus]VTS09475.1 unnamed protein product [Gemmata obscuriglobus UQM 2246]